MSKSRVKTAINVGVAMVDITPTSGLTMAGFAARTKPAKGMHDRLSVRAITVDNTALLIADVIGISASMSARIRARCTMPSQNIVIAALHNHAGPVSMADRLSIEPDKVWLERLENACITALNQAASQQQPATISIANGTDPDIGRNRRHANGVVDTNLPLIRIRDLNGKMLALIVNYACHPVVLGPDNLLWTADYPFYVREALEKAYPQALAIFVTGAIGDVNTGHQAHESISLTAMPERNFETAKLIGQKIAYCALNGTENPVQGHVSVSNASITLNFERREKLSPQELLALWEQKAKTAEPAQRSLLEYWCDWAKSKALEPLEPINARITLLNWSGIAIAAFPGEIFAESALDLRAQLKAYPHLLIAGFADDNPGYIPPLNEYTYGGYEIDEAHRYYGQTATFAPGSAELLIGGMVTLAVNQAQ